TWIIDAEAAYGSRRQCHRRNIPKSFHRAPHAWRRPRHDAAQTGSGWGRIPHEPFHRYLRTAVEPARGGKGAVLQDALAIRQAEVGVRIPYVDKQNQVRFHPCSLPEPAGKRKKFAACVVARAGGVQQPPEVTPHSAPVSPAR